MSERDELRLALVRLTNEVHGSIGICSELWRHEIGNTNLAFMELRVKEARELLDRIPVVESVEADVEAWFRTYSHDNGPLRFNGTPKDILVRMLAAFASSQQGVAEAVLAEAEWWEGKANEITASINQQIKRTDGAAEKSIAIAREMDERFKRLRAAAPVHPGKK